VRRQTGSYALRATPACRRRVKTGPPAPGENWAI
jgi:hypothetical protein